MTPKKNRFSYRGPRRAPVQADLKSVYRERVSRHEQLVEQKKWKEANRIHPGAKTYRVFSNGRPRGFLTATGEGQRQEAQKIEAVVRRLQAHGIFIPRITRIHPPHYVEFESGNKTLSDALTQLLSRKPNQPDFSPVQLDQKRKKAVQWIGRVFRMMGKVHALGVVHHHPHGANIILTKGTPGLIDLKYAEFIEKKIWNDPLAAQLIWTAFNEDYHNLMRILNANFGFYSPFRLNRKTEMQNLAWHLFKPYPCHESVKRELVERFLREAL